MQAHELDEQSPIGRNLIERSTAFSTSFLSPEGHINLRAIYELRSSMLALLRATIDVDSRAIANNTSSNLLILLLLDKSPSGTLPQDKFVGPAGVEKKIKVDLTVDGKLEATHNPTFSDVTTLIIKVGTFTPTIGTYKASIPNKSNARNLYTYRSREQLSTGEQSFQKPPERSSEPHANFDFYQATATTSTTTIGITPEAVPSHRYRKIDTAPSPLIDLLEAHLYHVVVPDNFAKNPPAFDMNTRAAIISKALILVLFASLAPDVYGTTFKCYQGETETCQYGSNNSIVHLRDHTFYCSGDGQPACCASIAGYNQCYAAQSH
ncbi:hypothetical protein H4Q26_013389 [Puccinia striiformis f. sp. tritici PST-130]|nr:hypothetical protein H4Q26_013389 [Puccinia striiformis f. sp. tritici PST-130]